MAKESRYLATNYLGKVSYYLLTYKVEFQYIPDRGIEFNATQEFVSGMIYSLCVSYGCPKWPTICKIKTKKSNGEDNQGTRK